MASRGSSRVNGTSPYLSWGRYPRVEPRAVVPVLWASEPPDLSSLEGPVLAYGYGRSYGDCCLNENGVLLDTSALTRFIAFDEQHGTLRCEAGVSLGQVLGLVVPRGWFLPVVPGTQVVSVGGAIANDIHGKNHHRAGTFGCHVTRFELLRSSGERLVCSADENADLFQATIGGLGLTGLILWAELRLKRIANPYIAMERVRFGSLDEFFALSAESDREFEYTVSWVDCLARRAELGRGIFFRGNHAPDDLEAQTDGAHRRAQRLAVPFDLPTGFLNPALVSAFNGMYYRYPPARSVRKVVGYEPFFFPLDAIKHWNRLYGSAGFLQYQCVLPDGAGHAALTELLGRVAVSREASFLAVLKRFGNQRSPGIMSFPRPGSTLALDLPYRGQRTLALLERLDRIVVEAGGAVYPAKDARMSAASFQRYFPRWPEFAVHIDPRFSSSLWRRVMAGQGAS